MAHLNALRHSTVPIQADENSARYFCLFGRSHFNQRGNSIPVCNKRALTDIAFNDEERLTAKLYLFMNEYVSQMLFKSARRQYMGVVNE